MFTLGNTSITTKTHSKYCYKAKEDCELLSISYNKIKDLIIKPAKENFLMRIKQLTETKYIKELNPYAIILLSIVGKVKDYNYGNIVIRQNNIPKAFYCVIEGECKSIHDRILVRSKEMQSKLRVSSIIKERSFDNEKIKLKNKEVTYRSHVSYINKV